MTNVQTGATPERLQLAARVAELRARGLTQKQVAAELGISRSYASTLDTDPDGAEQRRRRNGYSGTCERCGGETKSDGTAQASPHCGSCARELSLYWTPERIIEAIQAFHAEHGRCPSSPEWAGTAVEGRPYTSTVVGRFGSWANAIEAAGFPRPMSRGADYLIRPRGTALEYFVFRLNGSAELIGKTEARSIVQAIGNLADGEGQYGAISVSQIQVRDVKQQLAVVRPTAA